MKNFLENVLKSEFLSKEYNSKDLMQRGIADVLEKNVTNFIRKLESDSIKTFEAKSKRTIEDVKIIQFNKQYLIDIKTHDLGIEFSIPNLISIDRLKKIYSNFER